MLNRRKYPRALLPRALDGTLRLTESVVVERYASREITVVSGVPAVSDQRLAIAPVGMAPPEPLDVKVTQSVPAVVDGVLKHRLRLRVLDHEHLDRPRMGMLVRDVPIRVIDVSAGGCLLEASVPISHGTAGELHLAIDGQMRSDALRVCRCSLVRGAGSLFRIGAEFAPMPHGASVRALLAPTFDGDSIIAGAMGE